MTPKQKDVSVRSMTQETGMGATEQAVATVKRKVSVTTWRKGRGYQKAWSQRVSPNHQWLVDRLMSSFKDSSNKLANNPWEII